jgi:hypothetical protein
VGGKTKWKDSKTKSGVKDTFQAYFIDQVFAVLGRKGKPVEVKQQEVTTLKSSFARMDKVFPGDGIISPVWRIRGERFVLNWNYVQTERCLVDLDPHRDTPVEILHVIMLGFVKYFWRDAMNRLTPAEKRTVKTRISVRDSFGVLSLGFGGVR